MQRSLWSVTDSPMHATRDLGTSTLNALCVGLIPSTLVLFRYQTNKTVTISFLAKCFDNFRLKRWGGGGDAHGPAAVAVALERNRQCSAPLPALAFGPSLRVACAFAEPGSNTAAFIHR
jgi:hypothetical protein